MQASRILILLFFGIISASCAITTPKLGPPSSPAPVTQLREEGLIEPLGGSLRFLSGCIAKATFSLPPEQMAALIIRTAKQKGVQVEATKSWFGDWAVMVWKGFFNLPSLRMWAMLEYSRLPQEEVNFW